MHEKVVEYPLVTVVLLNWNGGEHVMGTIEHVLCQSYPAIEFIVIDNNSTDGSAQIIRDRYPRLHFVQNETNLGYAAGMNQGIALANGAFLLLLNQDAWLRHDYIEKAVALLQAQPDDVGMLGGKIYKLEDTEKSNRVLGGGLLLRRHFRYGHDPNVDTVHFTLSPTFCSPFFRRTLLEDLEDSTGHWFDERYFAFGEDLDLALRAQLRGWRCLFSPELVVWHLHSGSLGGRVRIWDKPPVFRKHALRNRYMTLLKDAPLSLLLTLMPFLLAAEAGAWILLSIRSMGTIPCLVQAYVETVQMLPETLRLRRKVQSTSRVKTGHLQQYLIGL